MGRGQEMVIKVLNECTTWGLVLCFAAVVIAAVADCSAFGAGAVAVACALRLVLLELLRVWCDLLYATPLFSETT